MKFTILLAALFLSAGSLMFPRISHAALDCSIADVSASQNNAQTMTVRTCLGGFASVADATQPIRIQVNCLDKSGLVHLTGDQCWTQQSLTVTPTSNLVAPSDNNGDGVNDSYFTCFDVEEINRDVGKIDVQYTSVSGQCATESTETLPANYDFWYEHVRRTFEDNSGYNDGDHVRSPLCADGGINTAIGCIDYDVIGFTRYMLGWSMGVGGGVALVLIAFAGIKMMLSAGDPGRLAEAKSLMVAAISGLLLIIFSTFLLRVIGVNILEIF